MATIPELLSGHFTSEAECLDRLYLNGYIGKLATSGGLVTFMREQLGKPIPSTVVLGQVTEKFREAVKIQAERDKIPIYPFDHKERKDDVANQMRRRRGVRDEIVFIGVAQEKAQYFSGKKVGGQFEFTRDKAVYVNHYYFYIDDADFGPLFVKVCSYAPWGLKLCLNGHEWAKRQLERRGIGYEALDNGFLSCVEPEKLQQICDSLGPEDIDRVFRKWLKRIPLPLRAQDREVARLFSRMEARVFRPAMAMFTANDAVLPFPPRQALDRVDSQLDWLILRRISASASKLKNSTLSERSWLDQTARASQIVPKPSLRHELCESPRVLNSCR
jgi:hypothetical protein